MSELHRYPYTAKTHIGLVRKLNEDSVLALPDHDIWMVSDGMGGHEAGDFASQTIADTVAVIPTGLAPDDREQALKQAIQTAHKKILTEAETRGRGVIGATVVALMMADNEYVGIWAGDSRIYRLRGGHIELLTTDHSAVADLVVAGKLTWDEAEKHMLANAITRAVGVGDDFELDTIRGQVQRGDRYLLCSDGLSKYATFDILQNALRDLPLETVSDALIDTALTGGGADNITVITIDVL